MARKEFYTTLTASRDFKILSIRNGEVRANHRACVYLNLDYLRYKFGMKFQLDRGLNLKRNFA